MMTKNKIEIVEYICSYAAKDIQPYSDEIPWCDINGNHTRIIRCGECLYSEKNEFGEGIVCIGFNFMKNTKEDDFCSEGIHFQDVQEHLEMSNYE